jgi:hypothetical protein
VLQDCETWSIALRDERRLKLFENRTLRRSFGPKGDENEKWRRLHNKKLHSFYHSRNIVRVINSRRLKWTGMEEGMIALKILTDKPTGKRLLGRPMCRREENIRLDPKKMYQYEELNCFGSR